MASLLPVTRRSIAESWRGFVGWTAGVIGALALYLPLYPSIAGPEMQTLIESLPEAMITALGYDQITSGAGYTQATFFGLIGFVLFAIAGIGWGAHAGGGEEESGRLELDLAHSISRTSYALQAMLTLILKFLLLGGVSYGVIAALNGPSELDLDTLRLLGAVGSLTALGTLIAATALAGGIMTGRTSFGVAAGTVVTVGGYVLNAVSNLVDDLEWLQVFSPYSWAFGTPPLIDGPDITGVIALVGAICVAGLIAVLSLRARDVVG
jgi:ABC-2 type transport system permease protein